MARVALLACIGGLAFVVCAFGGFLLWLLPAFVFLTIASLCNTHVSDSVRFVCYGPARRICVSWVRYGRRGVTSAPRFQLYVRCAAGPSRARGGCCAPVSGALVSQGAV